MSDAADLPDLDDATVLWSAGADERAGRPLLVMLHGYGADEHDLFGLAAFLPDEYVIAALRAPLAPPWPAPGYSWYPIEDIDGRDASGVTAAAERLLAWVEAHAPAPARVGLLGFSQGASVALQALRCAPDRFAFAVNLSGYVAPGALDHDEELAARRIPVFWGRGTRDDVIPPYLVAHTAQWLPDHADLSGRVYVGLTHSVSEQELDDVRTFLEKRLADPS
ncbi:MAG: esterase [Microbacterium sp.]|uniref:alpha/beta hydrolase n=1 Tax=Microbacterium sp. TaxID=51671 RepID=UPI001ACB91A8|nr:alpha/beta hydrolase-fold protein [Microbacterium sp.]MBN9155077.1 esterase [Microbacterium sp.]MBN9181445.1 esterase [Microbacterium sp.]